MRLKLQPVSVCRKMDALIGVIKDLIYCYINLLILIFSLNTVSCQADGAGTSYMPVQLGS